MQPDEIRAILREWGTATVNRYCVSHGDRSIHMLEQARDMAPGTKERAERELVGRDGTDRRRLMARAAGVESLETVPMWACDPIRSANDADPPHERSEIAVDAGIPDHLMWVERAIGRLERQFPLRAMILRTEYTVSASQAVKTHMVKEKYGGALSKWQYRRELQLAENAVETLHEARAA